MKLRDVAVVGIGMTRFGAYRDRTLVELAREAGLRALDDAGVSFREVDIRPLCLAEFRALGHAPFGIPIERLDLDQLVEKMRSMPAESRCDLTFENVQARMRTTLLMNTGFVVGTGDPNIDVPAVQAAVDQGGEVILKGHFSFDRPPMQPTVVAGYMATILVSSKVVISGTSDEEGGITSIAAGTVPFYVEAPGAHVEILGLRFIHPKAPCRNSGVSLCGPLASSNVNLSAAPSNS